MRQNPLLFIVGCPRSGTTLLQRMVDSHPSIAVPRETHWIPHYFRRRIGLTSDGLVTGELIARLCEYRTFSNLRIPRAELDRLLEASGPMHYSAFVSGVFDLYGRACGKCLVADKTPQYVEEIPLLHALWPTAKFIHLIRDGRDVCLSAMNWTKAGKLAARFAPWSEDPVSTAAFWWKRFVMLGRQDGTVLGPDLYFEIRYEALVRGPTDECAKLCAFLGLPYDDAMLRFHEGRTRTKPGLDAKHAWLPVTAGLRDWKREMPAADIERFEAAAGDLLEELGYERAFPEPGPAALQHGKRMRELFTQHLRTRQDRLPERWQVAPSTAS